MYKTLYPPLTPYKSQRMQADGIHNLYLEACGNPKGIPALFLHGGPGGGCTGSHRQYFDPEKYRIVLFDQRGCGRSTPHAELRENTTQGLIADIEAIRELLGIEQWMIFGGSWGSTLALAYAQAYPHCVSALVLRGIFLCRDEDIRWFYQFGCSEMFPDYWQDYLAPIAPEKHGNLLHAYHEVLTGDDEAKQLEAAKAWSLWEARTATLLPDQNVRDYFGDAKVALGMARIECHYFMNQSFMQPNQLINNIDKIRHIPTVIVQGRYDVICPPRQAYTLAEAFPEAVFKLIADAGHAASEPGIVDALVNATDQFAVQGEFK